MATGFGRGVRLGISPAITVLILVGIAIAVGIVAGMLVLSQTRSMASKGATIQLAVDAHDAGSGYTAITVMVKNTGPEDVKITSIQVIADGYTKCSDSPNKVIKAGGSTSFALVCKTGKGVGSVIAIKVTGETTRTGMPVQASTSVEILP